MKYFYLITCALWPLLASAQLAVSVLPVKTLGNKSVVSLVMKNAFPENIESARAACFLVDNQGTVVGRSTQWVIGSSRNKSPLASGATNTFNFVISADTPLKGTNLTAQVTFSRVVLEGGKLADPIKDVLVRKRFK